MKNLDIGEGLLSVFLGGIFVFIAFQICLGFAGFSGEQIMRAWEALAILWAPPLFFYGAK